ncbi:MAG: SDR family NAD(P)-dependent oxidoreductase [Gammaproteobacteria bacterium]|nr:SDR family NAD(P)-dependent oxidoreductase [Gammaproteobacteria bacterium]
MASDHQLKAVVAGVGPRRGLGGALCARFAREGHHVFVAGRTREKLDAVVDGIESAGGSATAVQCDVTHEASVRDLFDSVENTGNGKLDLAVYNAGNSTPGRIREMEADYFEQAWKTLCYGGFLFGREVVRRMGPGTLIYTGASASLRGKAGYGAFNSGKAALRTFAQALAKENGPEGLHVAHVVVDGGIAGDKWFGRLGGPPDEEMLKKFVSLDGLTETYWNLYRQTPRAWSFEVDIRTSLEQW